MENYWKTANVLKAFHFRIWGAILWDSQKQCSCLVVPVTHPKFSRVTHTGPAIALPGEFSMHFSTAGTWFYVSSGLCEDLEGLAGDGFMLVRSLPSSLRKGDGAGDLLAYVCEKTQGKEWAWLEVEVLLAESSCYSVTQLYSLISWWLILCANLTEPWGAQILGQT